MNVLVTGGAGYIGSHACKRLLDDGHAVLAVDNLSRGHGAAAELLRSRAPDRFTFVQADVNRRDVLEEAMGRHGTEAVMHFAALAAVGESVQHPLLYYRSNAAGLVSLLEACRARGVERFVFSSSCATYGQPPAELVPIPETCPQAPISPYGWTKLHGEHILRDLSASERLAGRPFAYAALRYFNVAGADLGGVFGEDHNPETHLIPVVLQAALGRRDGLDIFGVDYPTPDGTCIRDYVHVDDLVDAHVAVLHALKPGDELAFNLGIGKGYSVREIIRAAGAVCRVNIPAREKPRRPGDPPRLFADPRRIRESLGWNAKVTDIHAIIESAWEWFQRHPRGYGSV
jgi:UDP-glucose-4-epimerase GalE